MNPARPGPSGPATSNIVTSSCIVVLLEYCELSGHCSRATLIIVGVAQSSGAAASDFTVYKEFCWQRIDSVFGFLSGWVCFFASQGRLCFSLLFCGSNLPAHIEVPASYATIMVDTCAYCGLGSQISRRPTSCRYCMAVHYTRCKLRT